MRTLPLIGALALFGLAVEPASAQMCGGGQQVQASQARGMGGMCGGMGASAAEDDPMADKPAQKPQQSSMCPCCRNMAMMRGGQSGGSGGGMQHDNMPGMGQPK